jgi:hypothetical protein
VDSPLVWSPGLRDTILQGQGSLQYQWQCKSKTYLEMDDMVIGLPRGKGGKLQPLYSIYKPRRIRDACLVCV